MTKEQLEAFQCTARNHLGRPLKVDGIQGPETEWALDFETLSVARRAVVSMAQRHLGLVEDPIGSNRDPNGLILGWLTRCGCKPGDPWCAAFASWCIGFARIGGAQALGKHLEATTHPYPGDVMWYPTTGAQGHCGIVIGVGVDEVMTIEGNQDNAIRCVRRLVIGAGGKRLRFSRLTRENEGTCPGVVPSVHAPLGGTR